MSLEGGGEAEPLSVVATQKKVMRGDDFREFFDPGTHYVVPDATPLATELANYLLFTLKYLLSFLEYPASYRQMAGKLTRIL